MIRERDCIVLTQDIADTGLKAGDVGTVVDIHRGTAVYEVEFMTLTGQTLAVATVLPAQLRPVSARDVSHVRELAATQSSQPPTEQASTTRNGTVAPAGSPPVKKLCTKCQQEKDEAEFSFTRIRGRLLRRSWCDACMKKYYKAYHSAKARKARKRVGVA